MIEFESQADFVLDHQMRLRTWIVNTIQSEGYQVGEILYVFCDDSYLHGINLEFLNHDTLTDIITFDYNVDKEVNSEIYISIERVKENANDFGISFENELHRVMIHGILHLCGYKDESISEQKEIRSKEDKALVLLSKMP